MAYPIINAILVKNVASCDAAEAHGMATGLLCANPKIHASHWLAELLNPNTPIPAEQKSVLIRLFEETRQLLTGNDDFEFDLLLPDDDDTPFIEQVSALKNWCQGFLFGIGSAVIAGNCSRDAHDILKDITEFTKLDTDAEKQTEEDEHALIELTEYLRTAVLLLCDELSQYTGSDDEL
jgi:uncharacterized protein